MNEEKDDHNADELDTVAIDVQNYFKCFVFRMDRPLIFDHRDSQFGKHPLLSVIEKYVQLFPNHDEFVKYFMLEVLTIVTAIFEEVDYDLKNYSIQIFKARWEQIPTYLMQPFSTAIRDGIWDPKAGDMAKLCCALNGDSSILDFHLARRNLRPSEIVEFKVQLKRLVPEFVHRIAYIIHSDLRRKARKALTQEKQLCATIK
jgi:hypothetical protein